jgi:hypothetical protein
VSPLTRTRLGAALAGLVLFGAGAVAGAAASHAAHARQLRETLRRSPAEVRTVLVSRGLRARLALTDAQAARLEEVLREQEDEYAAAMACARPDVRALRHALVEALRDVLDAEQLAELVAAVAEADDAR